jgi:hypothetical protein
MAKRGQRKSSALILPDASKLGMFPHEKILIDPEQAAKALGRSVRTLRRWSSSPRRRLPFVKIGNRPAYVLEDLLEFIEKSKVRANA